MPGDQRGALEKLRDMIKATVPDAVETVSYGVPAFKYKGRPLVSIGATTNHCSFYVQSPAVMQAFAAELKAYGTAKGTVHFLPAEPLPEALVQKLVRARLAENEATAAGRRSGR